MCVTWLIHTCDMTHSCVSCDFFIRVTWLIHMWDKTHSYVWHDSFICVTWLICTYETIQTHVGAVHKFNICVAVCCCRSIPYIHDMTHSYVSHDFFICACLHTHIWRSHVTHMNETAGEGVCVCVCGCVCMWVCVCTCVCCCGFLCC